MITAVSITFAAHKPKSVTLTAETIINNFKGTIGSDSVKKFIASDNGFS